MDLRYSRSASGLGRARVVVAAALVTLASLVAWPLPSRAQQAKPPNLPEITVIGTTPVPGLFIDVDKIPGNVQSVSAADLAQMGSPSLVGALSSHVGSISISDSLADPFQPDVLYRGFAASPVLGTPQGLAVYQNGVRVNEAFGDSVNWDLIPDIAIERIDIVSSSPLYGLNALGGTLSVTMKNGFTSQGADATLSGGSFNQRQAAAEAGGSHGELGFYVAARALDEDGWRLFAHDSVRQYFVDLSLRGSATTADLSYASADNHLYGPGAAPVQSLALDRTAVFTGPQADANRLDFATLNASRALTSAMALQGVAYLRNFRQDLSNGNASNFTPCSAPAAAGLLCQDDSTTPLRDATGTALPDLSDGGQRVLGQNNFESIQSQTWGGSLQATGSAPWSGHDNQFAVGTAIDISHTHFLSGTQVGLLDAALIVQPSRLQVDTPEGTPFSATPVILGASTKYYGFYGTDTFDVDSAIAVTASGRYNVASIDLSDRRGTALSGQSRYVHFNPAIGATYRASGAITLFAGLSINNRTPTASEIECSDPLRPCLLPSSLAGDPPNLRQVVAHTMEIGLRGRWTRPDGVHGSWNVSTFRTESSDDIYGVATSVSSGFFENIGTTRRQGIETGWDYHADHWSIFEQYSYVAASFRSPLTLNSPSNPFSDAAGDIHVRPGDRLPGIPAHRVKLGVDWTPRPAWSVGASGAWVSGQFYHGDESNQNGRLPGYAVASLRLGFRPGTGAEIFATVQNMFNVRYATYGLFGDPTGVNAPGIPVGAATNDPGVDNRFQNPGAPRAVIGGVKWTF